VKLAETVLTTAEATDVQLKLALHARVCGCMKTADCLVMRDLRRMKAEIKDTESL
jgi:hypothetical protein